MPSFSYESFVFFIEDLNSGFNFLIEILSEIIDFVSSSPMLYIPMLIAVLIFGVFVVFILIVSLSDKSYGSNINTKFNFKRFQNPNTYFSTSFPAINQYFHLGKKIIRKHIAEQNRVKELNRKMAVKSATDEESLKYANEFFKNNPWSYKIHLNGTTYFRPGWEKVNWRKGKPEYKNKEVSFDVDKAKIQAKTNRADFGDPKNKRKH